MARKGKVKKAKKKPLEGVMMHFGAKEAPKQEAGY